ncbi:MAG: SDR family NAD(P)-dependent oxidoreductase [Myxococcota bacterium]|nr:SDR family NAD(P)-dependent oxidoreductase [Myxococcota bacterium]
MARYNIQNRIVLITGAAHGIGWATAQAFSQRGATVIMCDVDVQKGYERANELGEHTHFIPLDVRNRDAFIQVVNEIETRWGSLDVLINNAGIMPIGPMQDLSESTERQLFEINVFGAINGIHAVLPNMLHRNAGQIVNIASLMSHIPTPYAALYTGTKFAIRGVTEALRHELRATNVHLCVVYPSLVQTELVAGIRPLSFPPAVNPTQVARAIVQGVERKRLQVYIPKIGRFLGSLPTFLPQFALEKIAKLTGLTKLFYHIDTADRQSYRHRLKENAEPPTSS